MPTGTSPQPVEGRRQHRGDETVDRHRPRNARRREVEVVPDLVLRVGAPPEQLLAHDLAPQAQHVLTLVRRSEARYGPARLCDVQAPRGRLLAPPQPRA